MVFLRELIAEYNEHLAAGAPKLNQDGLGEATGIGAGLVSKHISGAHLMLYETALRYAQFFGKRPADVDDRFSEASIMATSTSGNTAGTSRT